MTFAQNENNLIVPAKDAIWRKEAVVYQRELNGKKIIVLLNFTDRSTAYNLNFKLGKHVIVLDNYNDCKKAKNNSLRPYEAMIIELQ